MGGGSSIETAHIYTHVNRYDVLTGKNILTRVSSFVFGGPLPSSLPPVTEAMFTTAPMGATTPFPTGKIGIQLEARQSVDDFFLLFEGARYMPHFDNAVKTELGDTFGDSPHLKWSGYTVSLPPPTDRFVMSALLKIVVTFKPDPGNPGVHAGIYAVPMVFGFMNIPFSQHYALGLTTLQPDSTTLVDTSVRLRL